MYIFIIGPMASGKSTVGRKLAKFLNMNFIDTDEEIEKKAGAEISWIFDKEGENGFRKREREILKKVCKRSNLVIATGGGTVLLSENRELMKLTGKVVYLDTPVRLQLERSLHDKRRPLLQDINKEKILEKLKKERSPLYTEIADITIKSDKKNINQIIIEIVDKINIKQNA